MSLEEFGTLTPAMFAALRERSVVNFKYQCYLQGIVASQIVNVKLTKGKELLTPFDFVPGIKSPRDDAKKNIMSLFAMMGEKGLSAEEYNAIRTRSINGMRESGVADAEELFDEVFTSWDSRGNK